MAILNHRMGLPLWKPEHLEEMRRQMLEYTFRVGPPSRNQITPDLVRNWIIQSMPAFLREAFPDIALLTILRREGPRFERAGWVSVPLDFEIAYYEDPTGYSSELFLRCERYVAKLVRCASLQVAGWIDPGQRFDQIPRRVHLALDGSLYWPDWDPDNMRAVPEGALEPLGGVTHPIIEHGRSSELQSLRVFEAKMRAAQQAMEKQSRRDAAMAPQISQVWINEAPQWLSPKEERALAKLKRLASKRNKV